MLACPKADGFIRPALTGKTLAQPHAVVNAVVGCQLMRHTNVQVEDGILYLPCVCRLSKNSCRGEHCSPVPVCL